MDTEYVCQKPVLLWFQVVKAFVVLTPKFKEVVENTGTGDLKTELQEFVQKKTAAYKYPRKIEFVDSLPKTVSVIWWHLYVIWSHSS